MRTRYVGTCACGDEREAVLEHDEQTVPPVNVWIGCRNLGGHTGRIVYDVRLSAAGPAAGENEQRQREEVGRLLHAELERELRAWAERDPQGFRDWQELGQMIDHAVSEAIGQAFEQTLEEGISAG